MMLIGYARVSTQDQTLRLQHDALTDGGCEKLFREKLSGTSTTLPAREKLLAFARKGDVVVVWKLDRRQAHVSHLCRTRRVRARHDP